MNMKEYQKVIGSLHYNYDASKRCCEAWGLKWLGDDFIRVADAEAKMNDFTQVQVDVAMKHMLWHVRWRFSPQNYNWKQRLAMAWWFLSGKMPAI